ncbi:MAG: hypothetical protein KGO83_06430 [Paenibacillaceae bacterium]|nr:hypothetical protein [Paenibacillaceae bacterium]
MMFLVRKHVGVCVVVAMLVATVTPARAQQRVDNMHIQHVLSSAQKLMEQCMARFSRDKENASVHAQTAHAEQCIRVVIAQMTDTRNASAAVLAVPSLMSALGSLLAGVGTLSAAAIGWVVAAVAAVVLLLAVAICYADNACRTQAQKHMDAIMSQVLGSLAQKWKWIGNHGDRIKKATAAMWNKVKPQGALTIGAAQRVVHYALNEFAKAKENIVRGRVLMSSGHQDARSSDDIETMRDNARHVDKTCSMVVEILIAQYELHVQEMRHLELINSELNKIKTSKIFSENAQHVDVQIMHNFKRLYDLLPNIFKAMHVPLNKSNTHYVNTVMKGLKEWRSFFKKPEKMANYGREIMRKSENLMEQMGGEWHPHDVVDTTKSVFQSRANIDKFIKTPNKVLYYLVQDILALFGGLAGGAFGLDRILYLMHGMRFADPASLKLFADMKKYMEIEQKEYDKFKKLFNEILDRGCTAEHQRNLDAIRDEIAKIKNDYKNVIDKFRNIYNYSIWEAGYHTTLSLYWETITKTKVTYNDKLKTILDAIEYFLKKIHKK